MYELGAILGYGMAILVWLAIPGVPAYFIIRHHRHKSDKWVRVQKNS